MKKDIRRLICYSFVSLFILVISCILLVDKIGILNFLAVFTGLIAVVLICIFVLKDVSLAVVFIVISLPFQAFYVWIGFSILPVRIVFILTLIIYILQCLKIGRFSFKSAGFMKYFVILLIVYLLSSMFAINIPRSLKATGTQLFDITFFIFIISILENSFQIDRVIKTSIIIGSLVAFFGIIQQIAFLSGIDLSLGFLEFLPRHPRVHGAGLMELHDVTNVIRTKSTFTEPNIFAGYLTSIIFYPLSLCIYYYQKRKKRKFYLFSTISILFVLTLISTLSRSAFIGFLLGFVILIYCWKDYVFKLRLWIKLLIITFIFIQVILICFPKIITMFEAFIKSYDLSELSASTASANLHAFLAQIAIEMFSKNPIVGVGYGNYGEYFSQHYLWHGVTNPYMMAHSAYLSFFAETGLLGGIINLTIIFLILRSGFNLINGMKNKNSYWWCLSIAMVCSVVGVLGANIFYQYYLVEFVWFSFALLIAGTSLLKREFNI